MNWYDWNKEAVSSTDTKAFAVGIDLHELIRLKLNYDNQYHNLLFQSGLICLNWYDWNVCASMKQPACCLLVGIDLPELIRLKPMSLSVSLFIHILSGLICLNWYDWNPVGIYWSSISLIGVGIDLPELIRLKLPLKLEIVVIRHSLSGLICLNWYDWNYFPSFREGRCFLWSGLICLNWYDWNRFQLFLVHLQCLRRDWSAWIDTIETRCYGLYGFMFKCVGIDLPELIRLKH